MSTNVSVSEQLSILQLNETIVKVPGGHVAVTGYVLQHPDLGVFGLRSDQVPYVPKRKSVLQAIINAGSMVSYENCAWFKII